MRTNNKYQRIQELGWSLNVLRQAKVMVVGAGALGNEVLKNLALLGVGNIWLCDMDKIETHNLSRTVLFTLSDVGKYKANVAAKAISKIDKQIKVHAYTQKVQACFGLGVFKEVDVVLGCVDNVQARIDINRYCYQTQTPFIDAGLRYLDGDVKIFAPPYDVCFDCLITQQMRDEAWRRFSCIKLRTDNTESQSLPTAPTISAIMAGFQVQWCVKYLHGQPIPTNKRLSVLGNIDDLSVSRMSNNPACPTHNLYDILPNRTAITALPIGATQHTAGELLQYLQAELQVQELSIALPFDVLTHFTCPTHKYTKTLVKVRGTVYADEVSCPYCIAEERVLAAAIMQEHFINQISNTTPKQVLQQKLVTLGVPPYHIIMVKTTGLNHTINYTYYSLAQDRAALGFAQ